MPNSKAKSLYISSFLINRHGIEIQNTKYITKYTIYNICKIICFMGENLQILIS